MKTGYSEFDIESIINEINSRYEEAKDKLNSNIKDEYYSGYWQAYYEVTEIIKNRLDK